MVNWLKWGLLAGLVGAVLIFRKQIGEFVVSGARGVGEFAGQAVGAGIGAIPRGLLTGFGTELSQFVPTGTGPSGQTTASPFGIPGPFDFLFKNGKVETIVGSSGVSTSTDIVVTPCNREQLAAIEQRAALSRNISPTIFQGVYRQVKKENVNVPIAGRLALQEQRIGAPSPLSIFYQLKAAGLSQTEAYRKMRELIAR